MFLFFVAACDCGGGGGGGVCETVSDCAPGEVCLDGRCRAGTDGAVSDASGDASPDADCEALCGSACCDDDERCAFDTCVPDVGTCESTDDCPGDTYCAEGACVPYGVPPGTITDPTCRRLDLSGVFAPTVQCAFTDAPAGDAWPAHLHVLATPMR